MRALIFALLSSSLGLFGAVTNVSIAPSRQQVVVTFTVKDPSQCALTVFVAGVKSEDTNGALFSGSEGCNRPYNVINGREVTAVIGRRTSEVALDGKMHSRSLQVATAYTITITDQADASIYYSAFTTTNIPWGDTKPEEVPYSATGYNHWAYPDIDYTDAGYDKSYIDPMTGVLFKRGPRELAGQAGPAGKYIYLETVYSTALDVHGSAWTNPTNALNTTTAGPFATYSGTARDPLWLPIGDFGSYNIGGTTLDDIRVNVYGYATDTGNVEDRKVLACIGTNYSFSTDLCTSPELELTLPAGSAAEVSAPSNWPSYGFAGWNVGRSLTNQEVSTVGWRAGVTVTNSAVSLPFDNTGYIPPQAVPGEPIAIGTTWYNIASVQNAVQFTLSQPGINGTNQGWQLGGFGVRLRKKTTVNNTINVAATYSSAFSGPPQDFGANGNVESCSRLTFSMGYDAAGVPLSAPVKARLCFSNGSSTGDTEAGWLFLLTDTGETRYLSPMRHYYISDSPETAWGAFHESDPYSMYAYQNGHFFKVTYDYATCHFARWAGNGYDHFSYPEDCVQGHWADLNGSGDIPTQMTAYMSTHPSPMWDSSFSSAFRVYKIMQAADGQVYSSMYLKPGGQDAGCFFAIVNVSAGAQLVKVFDTVYGAAGGLRWAGCHSNGFDMIYGSNYQPAVLSNLGTKCNAGSYMCGPYLLPAVTAVSTNGVSFNSADTTLNPGKWIACSGACTKAAADTRCTVAGTVEPWLDGQGNCIDLSNDGGYSANGVAGQCATNAYGITGPQCAWFKLPSDRPCTTVANSLEQAHSVTCPWGAGYSPMAYQPGDYMSRATLNYDSTSIDMFAVGKFEKFRILSKTSDGAGGWVLMVQRWAACDNPISSHTTYGGGSNYAVSFYDHLLSFGADALLFNTWRPYMSGTGNCAGGGLWIEITSPLETTQLLVENSDIGQEHNAIGASAVGRFSQVGHNASRADAMPAFLTDPPDKAPGGMDDSFFNGLWNTSSGVLEQYPSLTNWDAGNQARYRLYWDWRHLNPNSGSTPEAPINLFAQTYTLVSGQAMTYKVGPYLDTFSDFKTRPNQVFSSAGAFKSLSSPTTGNVISDAQPWNYCIAYKVNECRTGSSVGDVYVVAPNANILANACMTDTSRTYTPCVTPLWHHAGWMIEGDSRINDPLGTRRRRITMGFSGPAAQYQYTTPHMVPDTQWAFVKPFWPGGVRWDHMLVKLPPATEEDTVDRSKFIPVPITLPTGSSYARVRFGYAENGTASQFYCTPRAEACLTDASVAPFAWALSDSLTATDCRSGCTINIPALSGRILYYRIEKSANGSTNWMSGSLQAQVTP